MGFCLRFGNSVSRGWKYYCKYWSGSGIEHDDGRSDRNVGGFDIVPNEAV